MSSSLHGQQVHFWSGAQDIQHLECGVYVGRLPRDDYAPMLLIAGHQVTIKSALLITEPQGHEIPFCDVIEELKRLGATENDYRILIELANKVEAEL